MTFTKLGPGLCHYLKIIQFHLPALILTDFTEMELSLVIQPYHCPHTEPIYLILIHGWRAPDLEKHLLLPAFHPPSQPLGLYLFVSPRVPELIFLIHLYPQFRSDVTPMTSTLHRRRRDPTLPIAPFLEIVHLCMDSLYLEETSIGCDKGL